MELSQGQIEWFTLLWWTNSQRLCCYLIDLTWMRLTRTSVTSSGKQPKRLSHAAIETTIFRDGMRSVNLPIELSCGLLRETSWVWLLQLYLPNLTGSGDIDSSRQFGASIFYTLVEKYGVFWTTLLVGPTLSRHCLVSANAIASQIVRNGSTRLLIASYLDLFLKKCQTFGEPQRRTQWISLKTSHKENSQAPIRT